MHMELDPHKVSEDIAHEEIVEQPGATWQAPEYHHTPKTADWFWGVAIVSITIAIISALIGDVLFGIFVVLAAFTMAIFAHRPPRTVTVQMGTRGILVEKKLYLYNEIESFWIELEERQPKILFKSKRFWMPYILVPLGDMHPDDIGDFLLHFLPETEHKEPLLQRLLEDVGF